MNAGKRKMDNFLASLEFDIDSKLANEPNGLVLRHDNQQSVIKILSCLSNVNLERKTVRRGSDIKYIYMEKYLHINYLMPLT